jgi:hypothetical protein
MLIGSGAIFHVIGVIVILRAVVHALLHHDRKLSVEHDNIISSWKMATEGWKEGNSPLRFIDEARNLLLKEANFESYAIHTESSTGEEANRIVTGETYELSYYLNDERRDLAADIQTAIDWLGVELSRLEAKLPPRYETESDVDTWDFSDVLPDANSDERP